MTCFLCEKGFPITVDGWHYGSQSKGMIDTSLCAKVPFDVAKARAHGDSWTRAACDRIDEFQRALTGAHQDHGKVMESLVSCSRRAEQAEADAAAIIEAAERALAYNDGEYPDDDVDGLRNALAAHPAGSKILARLKAAEACVDWLKKAVPSFDSMTHQRIVGQLLASYHRASEADREPT